MFVSRLALRIADRLKAPLPLLLASISLLNTVGCQLTPSDESSSLYARLGARDGIAKLVDTFMVNCVTDPRINSFFLAAAADRAHLSRFKGNVADQLCELSGGPCHYAGKDMLAAHAGMGVTDEQFNAFIENFVKALDTAEIAKGDQEALVGILGPMRREIVAGDS